MKYLSSDQALVFGALKENKVMRRSDFKFLGITQLKLDRVLGLLEALDKCKTDGDNVYFIESAQQAALPVEITSSTDCEIEEPTQVPMAQQIEQFTAEINAGGPRPSCVEAVKFYYVNYCNTSQYSILNSDDTDFDATAQRFYDYYSSKGWKVGQNDIKDWTAMARRAVNDNAKKPAWCVVKKDVMQLAREADALRALKQQQATINELPDLSEDSAPWVEGQTLAERVNGFIRSNQVKDAEYA